MLLFNNWIDWSPLLFIYSSSSWIFYLDMSLGHSKKHRVITGNILPYMAGNRFKKTAHLCQENVLTTYRDSNNSEWYSIFHKLTHMYIGSADILVDITQVCTMLYNVSTYTNEQSFSRSAREVWKLSRLAQSDRLGSCFGWFVPIGQGAVWIGLSR